MRCVLVSYPLSLAVKFFQLCDGVFEKYQREDFFLKFFQLCDAVFVGTLIKRSMQNQDAATAWAVEALEAVKTARAKAVSDGLDPAEEAALAREATARLAVRAAEEAAAAKLEEASARRSAAVATAAESQAEEKRAQAAAAAAAAAERAAERAAAAETAEAAAREAKDAAQAAETLAREVRLQTRMRGH